MIRIHSEYEPLKAVMMHRPGPEIDRLAPSNLKELLFEDVPYHEKMVKEHDHFVDLIKSNSGAEVHYFFELLVEVLENDATRNDFVKYAKSEFNSITCSSLL